MLYYIENKKDVASSVDNLLQVLNQDLLSITVTRLGRSEDFCVSGVINSVSGEVPEELLKLFDEPLNISTENTQVG